MTARPIAEVLAGQRILLTGATGFVGEALLERMLYDLPETPVVLLVRSRGDLSARHRVQQVLNGPAFGRLRERRGDDLSPLLDHHITVLEGDLDEIPALPDDLDIVIHCAGEVSFDPPIDDGFATNVFGTLKLLAAIDASSSQPHYLHVSTAYVAGRQQGHIREGRLDHNVDWRDEAAFAAQLRERAELDSRSAENLSTFHTEADAEHVASGALSVSAEAERRRREWVSKTLIDAGRERGRSLGWTDCYTFTKAMAERAVEETAAQSARDGASAEHHRKRPGSAISGLDRRVQDGRADHPGVRPRRPAGVPRHPRRRDRHHPGRPGGQRDDRGGRTATRTR